MKNKSSRKRMANRGFKKRNKSPSFVIQKGEDGNFHHVPKNRIAVRTVVSQAVHRKGKTESQKQKDIRKTRLLKIRRKANVIAKASRKFNQQKEKTT